jgi:acetyl esterase/lipase
MKAVPVPPAFDPEMVGVLDQVRAFIPATGMTPEAVPALRAAFAHELANDELDPHGLWRFEDVDAPGSRGGPPVRLLLCRPRKEGPSGGWPVLYYAHGGGLVAGHRRSNLGDLLVLAEAAGAAVVSVEYRLAPEAPYPAALADCRAGLDWLRRGDATSGLDGQRIVTAGTSAGGGLMAALALEVRDRDDDPVLGQLLMAPMLDDRSSSGSAEQLEGIGVWDRVNNTTGWAAYLGGPEPAEVPSYAAPARALSLGHLPPTFLDCGDAETFRDEVVQFAAGIWRDGGNAELHVWPGGFHGFDTMVPHAALSRDAKHARSAWLQRVLGRSVSS